MSSDQDCRQTAAGRIRRGLWVAAVALAIVAPAAAQPEGGRFEFGLDVGLVYLGGERTEGTDGITQLRAGLFLTPRFELEGEWSRVDSGINAVLDRTLLNAVFNLARNERGQSYVLAGVGRAELDFDDFLPGDREESSSTVKVAAGRRFFLGPGSRLAVRFEASLWRETVLDAGSTVNAALTGGLTFRSGTEPVARLGEIGGRAWIDENGDGLDAGEPGLAGVSVSLSRDGEEAAPPARTDEQGRYGFADLDPGLYQLEFAAPPEFRIAPGGSPQEIEVVAGGRAQAGLGALRREWLGLSAGYRDGGVEVLVWADRNRNGSYEEGEDEGLAGIEILLTRLGETTGREAATDAAGKVFFDSCLPAAYDVALGDSEALNNYYVAPGTSPQRVKVPAPVGLSAVAERDTVTGRVWLDVDADGQEDDGEAGIGGARLRLAPRDGAGAEEAETGPDGRFRFEGRPAGGYELTLLETAALGGAPILPGTSPRSLNVPSRIGLVASALRDTILGRVGVDRNADSRLTPGEPGLEGVTVRLSRDGRGPSEVASRPDGSVGWTDRRPGNYRLEVLAESLPPGHWIPEESASRTVEVFSPVGLFAEGGEERIQGRLWLDENGNQQPDGEEPAVAGAQVSISRERQEIRRGEAGPEGTFGIEGLAAGGYEVAVDQSSLPPGMWPDPATSPRTVEVLPARNGSIAGSVVWVGGDGVEQPLGGQTIALRRDDQPLATAQTGPGGGFSFEELEPGPYELRLRFRPVGDVASPASPLTRAVEVQPGVPTDGSFRLAMVDLPPAPWLWWLLLIAAFGGALVWVISRWWKYGNMLAPCFRRWRIFRRGQRAELRRNIEAARRSGPGQLEQVSKKLGRVCCADWDIATEFFLAHRGHRAWAEMVAIAEAMSPHLSSKTLVRQQKAFALNRDGLSEQAEKILEELRDSRGPSAETCGLLGRVYKDRWDAARRSGAAAGADELLDQAIQAYRQGHDAQPSNPYPGINVLTLMAFTEAPEAERQALAATVRGAAQTNARSDATDYWAWATLLELAVHERDEGAAREALAQAVGATDERWQYETTLRNIRLIRSARDARGEESPAWVEEVEATLQGAFGAGAA